MLAEQEGKLLAALAYTGEVFNFVELRQELRGYGHTFRTDSDTEVVLRAYLQWGRDCAPRLRGMFAFAVWDAVRQELVLIRDRFGVYPLYYHRTADGVVFGSEPKAVLAHPRVGAPVDLDGLRELLSFAPTPGGSVYRGMPEVRPGHVIRISRSGWEDTTYWRLTAQPHTDDLDTTIRTIRELLEDSVAGQVVSDVPLCSMLSGGLDSSAVSALAARAVAKRTGERLRTFSVDFAGHIQRFRPDEMHATPDGPYAAQMATWLDTDHTEVLLDSADLLDPANRRAVIRALDAPATAGEMHTSLYLLSRAVRETSTVTLTGDAGDEMFGGYVWFHDEWYRRARTFPWVAASHDLEMLTGVLDRGLVAKLDIPGYQAARYAEALAEVPHLPGESGEERRIREISYLNLTRYLRVILDRKDRMGMAVALEGRVPLLDHRLVEYVFNIPWSMKSFDGREKSLLRAAVRDLLPKSVAERRKAPFPTTQDPLYRKGLRDQLGKVLADDAAPVRPLLDLDRARACLSGPDWGARRGVTRLSMDMAVQLNWWLADDKVELAL
jgi:asparagine synthase (glutamine-hydrolysing)